MDNHFTHVDAAGNARMVDVGEKAVTHRTAVAVGRAKKGDVLGVAQVAGIMATKRTSDLIPLCHTLLLTKSAVEFTLHPEEHSIEAECTVRCEGQTGVEMEALTGVSVALLTVYDMCKAISGGTSITCACPSPTAATCAANTVCPTGWSSRPTSRS